MKHNEQKRLVGVIAILGVLFVLSICLNIIQGLAYNVTFTKIQKYIADIDQRRTAQVEQLKDDIAKIQIVQGEKGDNAISTNTIIQKETIVQNPIDGRDGKDGREIELAIDSITGKQLYRYTGDTIWTDVQEVIR